MEVAKFVVIPTVDRSIDAKHALFDSGLQGSTVELSFANRLPETRLQITRDPRVLGQLLHGFQQTRHHALAPGKFGLQFHLDIAALHGARSEAKKHTRGVMEGVC